ncbi:hypothetical protein LIER_35386 [Lithospermum erythrorhizon]|uniref:LOB domain-containing protein n=1 Tax=Lithospermum erythrorhizon TaxID=34254 RepID=A0AAV3NQ99_LITER
MDLPSKCNMPCAACKYLRRRCSKQCIFLPYFLRKDLDKFAVVHKVFGASNISKLLQEIPVSDREDAVTSMVFEASERLRNPVYGCVSLIASLQKQVVELQSVLNTAHAEAMVLRLRMNMSEPSPTQLPIGVPPATNLPDETINYNSYCRQQLVERDYVPDYDSMLMQLYQDT